MRDSKPGARKREPPPGKRRDRGLWALACCALAWAACSLDGTPFARLEAEPARSGNADVTLSAAPDPQLNEFVARVVKDVDATWVEEFRRRDKPYVSATPVPFAQPAAAGPDAHDVPIDLGFQRALETRFGGEAAAPRAYAIAHAMGHYVQRTLGLDREVARLVADRPVAAHAVTLQLELQADCFAGIWARMTKTRDLLDRTQVERALRQASEEGATRLLAKDRDQPAPLETFTYAVPRRRLFWFGKGFAHAKVEDCDTFQPD
ncbi:MAG TPA: neutral zinc metallopeptidase [Polyangiaceae bacterium]|nr:neutral zinc metallopeptidase [Polyangiaceae bacterium]